MKIKWLFLFVLLAMPVCIYLFLQSFGENHFTIPMYYENGLEVINKGCAVENGKPYLVKPLSEIDKAIDPKLELNLVVLYGFNVTINQSLIRNNMMSFLNKYASDRRLSMLLVQSDSMPKDELNLKYDFVNHIVLDKLLMNDYARCMMQLKLDSMGDDQKLYSNQLVLCDQQRRIRGYYDASQLEEMDRLNTELDILLNK